jgi:serine/threonine protein kinase
MISGSRQMAQVPKPIPQVGFSLEYLQIGALGTMGALNADGKLYTTHYNANNKYTWEDCSNSFIKVVGTDHCYVITDPDQTGPKMRDIMHLRPVVDECMLRQLIRDVIELYDSLSIDVPISLRPDKIYCTPSGKFKFCPILPYNDQPSLNDDSHRYHSPEKLKSRNADREPSLVWSLGVILYELLYSEYCYPAEYSMFSELQNIVESRPKKAMNIGTHISKEMYWIIDACREYKPELRPTFKKLKEVLGHAHSIRSHLIFHCDKSICITLLCLVHRAGLGLPPELWDIILTYLFPCKTMYSLRGK